MTDAERLEDAAKKARREADIAKHEPIPADELDEYGNRECRETCHEQINLIELGLSLQNAYAAELKKLWQVIRRLRGEALYWRQKYEQEKGGKP